MMEIAVLPQEGSPTSLETDELLVSVVDPKFVFTSWYFVL